MSTGVHARLDEHLLDRGRALMAGGRAVLGICGAPGAGKSTLAARLAAAVGPAAVVVPMDGFHLHDDELARLGLSDRKGAPETFDVAGYVALLRRLHLETARALVITLDDPAAADELVAAARRERQDLLIIARARDAAHAAHLYRIGASDAVPETIEASLQLSEAVLVDVGVPMGPVIASIHEKRAALQDAIKAMVPEVKVRVRQRRRLRDRL